MTPKEFFAFAKKHKARMVDLKFTDPPGHLAALFVSDRDLERRNVQRRRRIRRILDSGVAGHQRV